jgi:DNA adenine methylase
MSTIKKLIDSGKISTINKNEDEFIFLPPKPILKWVGGKTQILDKIINNFPKEINNYHEIFLGGGSVLFGLLYMINNKKIKVKEQVYAYDLNHNLINLYQIIQKNPKNLYIEISKLINQYNTIKIEKGNKKPKNNDEALSSKESYYYWIRKNYNSIKLSNNDSEESKQNLIKNASMFIFLNKTCFRGLYRVGPNGFNVPYGNYKNPSILEEEHLMEISNLIKNVKFIHSDCISSLTKPLKNDFVYLDPPYAPENETSFVSYTNDGFDLDKHIKLFQSCFELKKKNIKFMISNADVELVRNNFNGYNIQSIDCKRSINSKNPGAKTKEVIIKSFF